MSTPHETPGGEETPNEKVPNLNIKSKKQSENHVEAHLWDIQPSGNDFNTVQDNS